MAKQYIAESVSYLHPDKICDQISDLLLDELLKIDKQSRVALEVVGGHGRVGIYGELTTKSNIAIESLVKGYYMKLTGNNIEIDINVVTQSPQISQGVDNGGAGDQGIMVGYACSENDMYLPQEMYLARKLLEGLNTDAKSQVTIKDGSLSSIVVSAQNFTQAQLQKRVVKICELGEDTKVYANNTGAFTIGGFDADSGCTGRKIVVDAYGPRVPVGGGAFSGKDPTKVDRSAAYMARWIALYLLHKHSASEVLVRLGYVIGGDQPLITQAVIDGVEIDFDIDCRPAAIIERFDLLRPIYLNTARNGHFGHIGIYPWESDFK